METKPVFAYLFFSLFVFVALSLLISNFSSTFSQLFSILSEDGGVFNTFLYCLDLFGFLLCLYTLILSSWNQKNDLRVKGIIFALAIGFMFLFVFELQNQHQPFSILEMMSELSGDFKELFRLGEFLFFLIFYVAFVFCPLIVLGLGITFSSKKHHVSSKYDWFKLANQLRPSINVMIYAMMGYALQSYFHKSYWFFYLDLLGFMIGALLLGWVYYKRRRDFGFYEVSNLIFLCIGVMIFALSSKIITSEDFMARYVFFTLAFVAWCAEWMMKFSKSDLS